jgi:S-methylmethionine-dependent homocysteine/selenocysteine methylase
LFSLQLPGKPVLLDGGLGRELRFRGVAVPNTIWSAAALMTDPAVVRQIHLDYITAGADVITRTPMASSAVTLPKRQSKLI